MNSLSSGLKVSDLTGIWLKTFVTRVKLNSEVSF